MSPPRDPSEIRIDPGTMPREQIMLMLGELIANAKQAALDRSRIDKKIDDMGGELVRVAGDIRVYASEDRAEHDKLASRIGALSLLLVGEVGKEEGGLTKRVSALENAQRGQKNMMAGIAIGAGLSGTGLGAAINWVGKKLGWWG